MDRNRTRSGPADLVIATGRRRHLATTLRVLALGYLYWLFGNLYEAVVKVPDLLARAPLTSAVGVGSPIRYYVPAIVLVVGALGTALVLTRTRMERTSLIVISASLLAALFITAYSVKVVNLRLFVAGTQVTVDE